MSSPHLRRRYRATGARSGLAYLFLILGLAALYVGQRVYTGRRQITLEHLQDQIDTQHTLCAQLRAQRDSLLSLAVIQPRAERLGLAPVRLNQMARLPLSAPALRHPPEPSAPVALADAAGRIWRWLDPPAPSLQSAQAGE